MAHTKINGNNIDTTTQALIKILQLSGNGSYLEIPKYANAAAISTALPSPAYGTIVFDSAEDSAQIYVADAQQGNPGWTSVGGGGAGLGDKSIIRTNAATIDENLTLGAASNAPENANSISIGPVTISNGYTISMDASAEWTIIGGGNYGAGLYTRSTA